LRAPRLRWSQPKYTPRRGTVAGTRKVRQSPKAEPRDRIERLGKIRGAILDTLDASEGGTLTLRQIADTLHRKRPRDIRRRNLPMLENAGIVQVNGDAVSLTDRWLEALEAQRLIGKEIEAEELAERRYKVKSRAFHRRHEAKLPKSRPSVVGLTAVRESRDRRRTYLDAREPGDTAANTPSDAELVAMRRRVERLVREGMARRFAEQAVIGSAMRSGPPSGPPREPGETGEPSRKKRSWPRMVDGVYVHGAVCECEWCAA